MGAEVHLTEGGVFSLAVVGNGEIMLLEALSEDGDETVIKYVFGGTREGVGPASLDSLRNAFLEWRQGPGRDPSVPIELILSDLPDDEFAFHQEFSTSPSLVLDGKRLLVRIATLPSPPPPAEDLRQLFEPFLRRHGASCHEIAVEDHWDPFSRGEELRTTQVLIDWPIEGRTVAEAWSFGEAALSLLRASENGELTQANALDLLHGDKWDLFLDQAESEWLDVKRAPYLSAGDIWKNELAKDVAAFANRPDGGVIVLGMRTEKDGELDVIKEVNQIDLSLVSAERYRKVVGDRVYPAVEGFSVEPIPGAAAGRGIVVLTVPPQPPSSFPFLVKGMVEAETLRDHYILLPFRRADETAFSDIASIHVRLRLGQQALDAEGRPRAGD